jgi:hypothetical protein
LLIDFADACNLHWIPDFEMPSKNTNPRLHTMLMAFLREVYKHDIEQKELNLLVGDVLAYNEIIEDSQLFSFHPMLSGQERREILCRFSSSNATLAREFLGRGDGKLFIENAVRDGADAVASAPDIAEAFMLALELWRRGGMMHHTPRQGQQDVEAEQRVMGWKENIRNKMSLLSSALSLRISDLFRYLNRLLGR